MSPILRDRPGDPGQCRTSMLAFVMSGELLLGTAKNRRSGSMSTVRMLCHEPGIADRRAIRYLAFLIGCQGCRPPGWQWACGERSWQGGTGARREPSAPTASERRGASHERQRAGWGSRSPGRPHGPTRPRSLSQFVGSAPKIPGRRRRSMPDGTAGLRSEGARLGRQRQIACRALVPYDCHGDRAIWGSHELGTLRNLVRRGRARRGCRPE